MNINAVNQFNTKYSSFGRKKVKSENNENQPIKNKKHNTASKVLLTAGAFAAGAAVGIIAYKRLPKLLFAAGAFATGAALNIKKPIDEEKEAQDISYSLNDDASSVTKTLKNGIRIKESFTNQPLVGETVVTEIINPVNDVAKVVTKKNVRGKITQITAYDKDGKEIKNILNSYDYNAGGRLSDVKTLTPQYKNFKYEYNKGVLEKIRFEDEFEQNYVIPVKKNMGDKIVEAGKKLRSIFF